MINKYTLGLSCLGMSIYSLDASVNLGIGFREGLGKAHLVRGIGKACFLKIDEANSISLMNLTPYSWLLIDVQSLLFGGGVVHGGFDAP